MRYAAYIALLISINSIAQTNGDWIESGQLKLRVNADGQLATFNNSAASELVSGSNNHLFKFINLWISGYDNSNQLRITSVNGFNNKSDYSPGPIDSLTFAGAEPAMWNHVWSVTATDIKDHRKNFQNTNYTVAEAIKNWPANGTARFNKYLAPFIDYDKNGIYEPLKGDYPEIMGEKSSYFILNDNYSEHKASGGQPLKIEIYGMAYTLPGVTNTVFAKYYMINRTDKNFTDIKVSFHTGFQLGNDRDNYIGTLVPQNLIFSYNGDPEDEGYFGSGKPLAAVMVLNKELSSSIYITNDADTNTAMPSTPENHRNMMEGKWRSSETLTFGNDGLGNGAPANFVYPGKTDPAFTGQNWIENNMPGERSILANMSYTGLMSKGFIELDIAMTGYATSQGDPYQLLENRANEIKAAWKNQVASFKHKFNEDAFIFQNPVNTGEQIYQPWFSNFKRILIYNAMGQLVENFDTKVKNTFSIETKGMYYVRFITDNHNITKKILIF